MNAHRIVLLSLAAGLLAAAAVSLTGGTPSKAGFAKAKQAGRGEYLTTLMGCGDCHTPGTFYGAPDLGRNLSGSEVGWQGAWGVTYARNLTPDRATGIGKWTEQDIVKALRTGTWPDGSVIQPPMPWPNYARMSDDDAYAIAAFLKSIPAVAHRVPDRVPPGQKVAGAVIAIPPPSPWDAPRTSPATVMPAAERGR